MTNKILIATDGKTDITEITSITISDKKSVTIIYNNGRTVQYAYDSHFDKDKFGVAEYDKRRALDE